MLVIIDCQKKYTAVELVADAVIRQIALAKQRSEWIAVVGFGGRTLTRITQHLRGYPRVIRITKDFDDGSPAIFERLFAYHWRSNNNLNTKQVVIVRHFRVVGVNTSACVMKTVDGLRRFAAVTVISKACANSNNMTGLMQITPEAHHHAALRRMGKWKNVRIMK
jgi:hypothetical protein